MAFQFTTEDFERYVKASEHGGRHIWHEVQDRLSESHKKVPFAADHYAIRSDPLQLIWFRPRHSPRKEWRYQAKLYIGRVMHEALYVGLHLQRPPAQYFEAEKAAEEGWEPPSDGVRFLERVRNDAEMHARLKDLLAQPGWMVEIVEWGKGIAIGDQSPLANIQALGVEPNDQGIDIYLYKRIPAADAIATGVAITDQIMEAFQAVEPTWLLSIPDEDREYLLTGGANKPPGATKLNPAKGGDPMLDPFDVLGLIKAQLSAQHLHFTEWQIASFYTALQTKGFVILSGISGTGKSKLAQEFAGLLPSPASLSPSMTDDDAIVLTVQPYMAKYSRIIVPKRATRLFDPPPPGEARQMTIAYDGRSSQGRLVYSVYPGTNYIALYLRGDARQWLERTFQPNDTLILTPEMNKDGELVGFQLAQEQDFKLRVVDQQRSDNHLFVPVRTDWRDSKSLLGYYNPLTESYEWTTFLRFVLRAVQSYRRQEGTAWFVILDEMNLARVEYYFADLLSVLESGRDIEGWTREPIRLAYPEGAEGELPPAEVYLPPNVYVIGTVNVDETTHAFSAKVLDRAFTLELTEADFRSYPFGSAGSAGELSPEQRQSLLANFSFDGRFVRVDKPAITAMVGKEPAVRDRLQRLNELLRPHDLHFGYRVFDEITSFLISAERNHTFEALGGFDAAFDAAVLMKVLPKFNGSRGRLEEPLKGVLAWCLDPDAPDRARVDAETQSGNADQVRTALASLPYRYPMTAARASRMLWALYTDGFAAFS